MSKMVRVAIKGNGTILTIIKLETGKPALGLDLTEKQAADIYGQLGRMLPDELLNEDLGSADELDEESAR